MRFLLQERRDAPYMEREKSADNVDQLITSLIEVTTRGICLINNI